MHTLQGLAATWGAGDLAAAADSETAVRRAPRGRWRVDGQLYVAKSRGRNQTCGALLGAT